VRPSRRRRRRPSATFAHASPRRHRTL
jgi:hypothetical protein